MMGDNCGFTLLVPVFNNAKDLPETLSEIDRALDGCGAGFDVLFVNDGSTDESAKIIREYASSRNSVRFIEHERNRGLHAALAAGFNNAHTPVVVTMEAHVQFDIMEVLRLNALMSDGVDIVCACRVRRKDPFHRLAGSLIVNTLLGSICGLPLRDFNCLLKAWRREAGVSAFEDTSHSHFFESLLSMNLVETPVEFSKQRKGHSSFSMLSLFKIGAEVLVMALKVRIKGGRRPSR